MEVPSWVGTVATGVGLSNPITAPIVVGKWVADKANSALGPKTESAPAIQPQSPPQTPAPAANPPAQPQPQVQNETGQVVPTYNNATSHQAANNQPLEKDGKWDGAAIMNGQTQVGKGEQNSKEAQHRCGPSAVLGAAVMGGKDSTLKLVQNLEARAPGADKAEVARIRQQIEQGKATHGDLTRLQHIMYTTYHGPVDPKNANQDLNMSSGDIQKMEKELAGDNSFQANSSFTDFGDRTGSSFQRTGQSDKSQVVMSPDRMQSKLGQLQKGQSFVQLVASGNQGLDHYVTVGRDKDGRTYVYDPGGKDNQPQVVYQDERPQAFNQYTGGAMGGKDNGRNAVAQAGGVVTF
jgi:hypothetical protein